jgi:trigger factor
VGEDSIMDNHDWDLLLKEESGWLPGFTEAFVGIKAGEEKEFTIKYPEDSSSRYKGQEATFKATMKTVKARLEPELNDEFAKTLGDYESVADMRAKLQEQLTRERTSEAESNLNEAALEAVVTQAHLKYPPVAIDETVDSMLDEVRRNLSRAGYGLEDYIRLQGMTLDKYREQLRPQAEKRLQGRLVLGKLAEVERIEVTPEDIQAEIERMAPADSEDEQAKALLEVLNTPSGQALVRQDLQTTKTLARLREIATGKAPDLPGPAGETAKTEAVDAEGKAKAEQPAVPAPEKDKGEQPAEPAVEPAATQQDELVTWESGTAVPEPAANEEPTKEEEE